MGGGPTRTHMMTEINEIDPEKVKRLVKYGSRSPEQPNAFLLNNNKR